MSLWYWVSEINFDKEVRKKKNFSGSDKMFTDDKATKELQNKYYFFKQFKQVENLQKLQLRNGKRSFKNVHRRWHVY